MYETWSRTSGTCVSAALSYNSKEDFMNITKMSFIGSRTSVAIQFNARHRGRSCRLTKIPQCSRITGYEQITDWSFRRNEASFSLLYAGSFSSRLNRPSALAQIFAKILLRCRIVRLKAREIPPATVDHDVRSEERERFLQLTAVKKNISALEK